ncbi:uncharacterized mitochondrial protein AtMg00810-like [Miscanthus floridulus]|uniref:uncharacterized mitochondrial protein AtMg00810-like n=1 Tax=Miscanthus floridulus TaxID=154761 RepID=UPI003459B4A2
MASCFTNCAGNAPAPPMVPPAPKEHALPAATMAAPVVPLPVPMEHPELGNLCFANYIQTIGFATSKSDASLFVYKDENRVAYLLLYVNDIILTAPSTELLWHITARLHSKFAIMDLGDLHHFLRIVVTRDRSALFLSQRQYAIDLLQQASMLECHPTTTPADARTKLSATNDAPITDPSAYRSLTSASQYLTLTWPDLTFAVQQVYLFMHDPCEPHLALIKRILHYVKGALPTGLHLGTGPVDQITAYPDADWVDCPDTHHSTSGFYVFLNDNLASVLILQMPDHGLPL